MQYYSQRSHKQDEYLYKNFFYDTYDGFFVDVGAHDGIDISNSYFFEKNFNWKGINIEPIPYIYNKLKENRTNSINLNCAISNEECDDVPFLLGIGYTEMLSGLVKSYDPRHLQRMDTENIYHNSRKEIIYVKTRTLESIFDEYNVKHINYLSIDTEGSEFDVIKSINFDKVFIDIIDFENNYLDVGEPIIEYLKNKDYKILKSGNEVFMIHKNSKFNEKFRNINVGLDTN